MMAIVSYSKLLLLLVGDCEMKEETKEAGELTRRMVVTTMLDSLQFRLVVHSN
jgi:hypothetical protein